MKLPIYPADAFLPEHAEQLLSEPESDPFVFKDKTYWGPKARWLLQAILAQAKLKRTDEIAILTTTDWTYISTCVSVTAFNFCRISRVVTEATRVVIVVHEFGYVFPEIARQTAAWKERGILVIEDCAHLIGIETDGGQVGSFGDFTLVSLSKLLPVRSGGMLLTTRSFSVPKMTMDEEQDTQIGRAAAERYIGHYRWLTKARLQRHRILAEGVGERVWMPASEAVPFATYIRRRDDSPALPGVEFLSTLNTDFILLPTNPFVDKSIFREISSDV